MMIRPFRRYFELSGRSNRTEYWLFAAFQSLIVIGLFIGWVGLVVVSPPRSMMIPSIILGIGYSVFVLACIPPNISLTIRRLHDSGRSGWWLGLLAPLLLATAQTVSVALREVRTTPHEMPQIMADHVTNTVLGMSSLICILTLFVYLILPGTPAANRFGEPPKGRRLIPEIIPAPHARVTAKIAIPDITDTETPYEAMPERMAARVRLSNLPFKPALQKTALLPVTSSSAAMEPIPLYRTATPLRPHSSGDKPAQPFGRRGVN
jgi:uncharacterized membrane protein YhaH (DUF805 family)